MKRKTEILKRLIGGLALCVVAIFSVESSFAQCDGIYFKTNYRKLLNGFADFKLDDWTGDGKSDFWTFQTNPNTLKQDVVIYPSVGNNDWNWANPIISTTQIPRYEQFADKYSLIDWDSDGDKDIFFEYAGTYYTVYLNNNNGTFTTLSTQFSETQVYSTVGFLDINGDNLLDWVNVANAPGQGHSIGYLLSTANGTFAQRVSLIANTSLISTSGKLGDFNGDGRTDILCALGVLRNNGGGSFTLGSASIGEVADFNNDGKADILVEVPPNNTPVTPRRIFISYGQADGSFNNVEYPVFNSASSNGGLRIGDFNGDNKLDFIENYNKSINAPFPFYSVFINNGSSGFTRTEYRRELGEFQDLVFSDFNGDGKTDIFVKTYSSMYIGNLFGEQVITIRYNQCQGFGETKSINFDGNEVNDLSLWNPNTGDWRTKNAAWFNSVEPSYRVFNWGLGSFGDVPAPGDFDGDGKTDYSVYRNSTGTWYIFLSANSAWYVLRFGLSGDIAVPNDYDGGGKTDIAVFRPSDGNWYILSSETEQFSALHFGTNGDKPVAQDYDGDGKTDVAVYRPSEGIWYYLKSSDGNYAAIRWGISTDYPVPADYDGDGKSDITVFRNGIWYFLRSYDNMPRYFSLGTNGDVPQAFYSNKESAQPIIYRSSEWKWYNLASWQQISFGGNQFSPIYFGLPNN